MASLGAALAVRRPVPRLLQWILFKVVKVAFCPTLLLPTPTCHHASPAAAGLEDSGAAAGGGCHHDIQGSNHRIPPGHHKCAAPPPPPPAACLCRLLPASRTPEGAKRACAQWAHVCMCAAGCRIACPDTPPCCLIHPPPPSSPQTAPRRGWGQRAPPRRAQPRAASS
jgi:hypothetical protein